MQQSQKSSALKESPALSNPQSIQDSNQNKSNDTLKSPGKGKLSETAEGTLFKKMISLKMQEHRKVTKKSAQKHEQAELRKECFDRKYSRFKKKVTHSRFETTKAIYTWPTPDEIA